MQSNIKNSFRIVTKPMLLRKLLSMSAHGYLKEVGWVDSVISGKPLDSQRNPLAWVTYPFIDFIQARLNKTMRVFEYGSGNSTLYYANLVGSVTAIEHDRSWYDQLSKDIPGNVDLHFQSLDPIIDYACYPNTLKKNFQIIIVDGRNRVNCVVEATTALADDGVIVLDDSERLKYREGIELLTKLGFKKIDFWGVAPGISYKKATTIFYKNKNCIGL